MVTSLLSLPGLLSHICHMAALKLSSLLSFVTKCWKASEVNNCWKINLGSAPHYSASAMASLVTTVLELASVTKANKPLGMKYFFASLPVAPQLHTHVPGTASAAAPRPMETPPHKAPDCSVTFTVLWSPLVCPLHGVAKDEVCEPAGQKWLLNSWLPSGIYLLPHRQTFCDAWYRCALDNGTNGP